MALFGRYLALTLYIQHVDTQIDARYCNDTTYAPDIEAMLLTPYCRDR